MVTTSPTCNLYNIVVLPAPSSPRINIRLSFWPTRAEKTREKNPPVNKKRFLLIKTILNRTDSRDKEQIQTDDQLVVAFKAMSRVLITCFRLGPLYNVEERSDYYNRLIRFISSLKIWQAVQRLLPLVIGFMLLL